MAKHDIIDLKFQRVVWKVVCRVQFADGHSTVAWGLTRHGALKKARRLY